MANADGSFKGVFIGRVVREDPAMQFSQKGNEMLKFTLRVTTYDRNNEDGNTTWLNVLSFDVPLINRVVSFARKGTRLQVIGDVKIDTYQASSGETRVSVTCFANSIEPIFDAKREDDDDGYDVNEDDDDDLPF